MGHRNFHKLVIRYLAGPWPIARKVASLMRGRADEVELLTITDHDILKIWPKFPDFAKLLQPGMPVIFDHKHLLHMDNSGHLRGIPAREDRREDLCPIHPLDFQHLPRIVHEPDKISEMEPGPNGPRLKFRKRFNHTTTAVLEFDQEKQRLLLVTMYNHSKMAPEP